MLFSLSSTDLDGGGCDRLFVVDGGEVSLCGGTQIFLKKNDSNNQVRSTSGIPTS